MRNWIIILFRAYIHRAMLGIHISCDRRTCARIIIIANTQVKRITQTCSWVPVLVDTIAHIRRYTWNVVGLFFVRSYPNINDEGVSTLNHQACSAWYSGTLKLSSQRFEHMQNQSAIFFSIAPGIKWGYTRFLNVFSIINHMCTHSFSHEYNTLYTIRTHRSVLFMWSSLRLASINLWWSLISTEP
jgi:hypothetical protein